jgi:AcrR family transcriptional regulator
MCPYPAQVTRETIIQRAHELLERTGVEQLTLQSLASSLGIQAPSLYRHMQNKTDLLRAVNELTVRQMVTALTDSVSVGDDMHTRFVRLCRAYRDFARSNPVTYGLAFGCLNPNQQPDSTLLEMISNPLQRMMAEMTDQPASRAALRGAWAMLHGYVMLELSGQFHSGGTLDDHFEQSIAAYLRGWIQH